MKRITFTVPPASDGSRVDRAIAARLREDGVELSNRRAKQLVEGGSVKVGDRSFWKASATVKCGDVVQFDVPEDLAAKAAPPRDLAPSVVFEDHFLIAINKPAGLPTHATHDPDRDHARAGVMRLLNERGTEHPYVGVHHRLDVDTSGVLVFAIDRAANKGLADAFSQRQAQKTYQALGIARTEDRPGDTWVIDNFLGRDRSSSTSKNTAVHAGGDAARTSFEMRDVAGGVAWILAKPLTGRMHQIRVHLSESGRPILGDALYGGPPSVGTTPVARLMLHAARLTLPHPVTGEELNLEAPVPDDFRETAQRLGITGV